MALLGYCLLSAALIPGADDPKALLDAPVIARLWESARPAGEGGVPDAVAEVPLSIRADHFDADPARVEVTRIADGGHQPLTILRMGLAEKDATSRVFDLPKFARGKHKIKVGFQRKVDGSWVYSQPIEFEVSSPPPPIVLAAYQQGDEPTRLPDNRVVPISGLPMTVKVSGVLPGDKLLIYVGQKKQLEGTVLAEGAYELPLTGKEIPVKGAHVLTVKVKRPGYEYVSNPSAPVTIQFGEPPMEKVPAEEPAKTQAEKSSKEVKPEPVAQPKPEPPPLIFCRTPDTFTHKPLVRRIHTLYSFAEGAAADAGKKEPPSLEQEAQAAGQLFWKFRFDEAAQVPMPVFDLYGGRGDEEGAVIYEGMKLIVAPDGRYELRFTMSTPAMPTTLRLQLAVIDRSGRPIVLTLPPINAGHDDDFQQIYWRQQWQVYHAGHSDALAEAFAQLCAVSRIGVARFGSRPGQINPGATLTYSAAPR